MINNDGISKKQIKINQFIQNYNQILMKRQKKLEEKLKKMKNNIIQLIQKYKKKLSKLINYIICKDFVMKEDLKFQKQRTFKNSLIK